VIDGRPVRCSGRGRRGGMLLEVMVSLALFAGAAALALGVARSTVRSIDRIERERFAEDLARSLLAELELGRVSVLTLRDGWPERLGSMDSFDERLDLLGEQRGVAWTIDVRTQRSEYPGLSLVELTVTEAAVGAGATSSSAIPTLDEIERGMGGGAADDPELRVVVRRLMHLREDDPEAYEADEIMDDLPDPGDEDDVDPFAEGAIP